MEPKKARRIIYNLLEVAYDAALVGIQDGGKRVDIVSSHNYPDKVMKLAESERLMDKAIRAAWQAMTGQPIPSGKDPVEFIYGEN